MAQVEQEASQFSGFFWDLLASQGGELRQMAFGKPLLTSIELEKIQLK